MLLQIIRSIIDTPDCATAISPRILKLTHPFRLKMYVWTSLMLPLIWINHRWPYASTEEWASPWLGVPMLVSPSVWLLFRIPHVLIRHTHTHSLNFPWLIIIMHNNLYTFKNQCGTCGFWCLLSIRAINESLPSSFLWAKWNLQQDVQCHVHNEHTGNTKPSMQWSIQLWSYAPTGTLWPSKFDPCTSSS